MNRLVITCSECSREQPHCARGLCSACYRRLRYKGGQLPPTVRPIGETCSVVGCEQGAHGGLLCRTHYMRKWRYGDPNHVSDKVRWREAAEAMFARCRTLDALDDGECWPWTGATRKNGYGQHRAHGTNLAHRGVWIEVFGPIQPEALFVCHHCDNPPCVRPSHLFLGTGAQNVADMMAKGREARNYGDDHHNFKLTDAQVEEIRALRRTGLLLRAIGDRYGVDSSHIGKICRGQSRTIPGGEREVDKIHAHGWSGAA